MTRERTTHDGTYIEVEEERAKVDERAAATEASSDVYIPEERDPNRPIGYRNSPDGVARAKELLATVAGLPAPSAEDPPATSVAEAKLRMAQQYSASARLQASRFLDGLLGPLSPLSLDETKQARAAAVESLASAMLGVREYAIDECAAAVEGMEAALAPNGLSPNGQPIRAAVYSSGIRAIKMASLVAPALANQVASRNSETS
jgi:hypothetical protein